MKSFLRNAFHIILQISLPLFLIYLFAKSFGFESNHWVLLIRNKLPEKIEIKKAAEPKKKVLPNEAKPKKSATENQSEQRSDRKSVAPSNPTTDAN